MHYIASVLTFFVFMINISYGQSFECDNNFGDCGTPNQSGGGGGGGGSILIANTDLGDTYQHADDFDDDGVEDPSDNCLRIKNPDQTDRDGDGIGDACDNCMSVWNPEQVNTDDDIFGNSCDNDDDNDGYEDYEDNCPIYWGIDYCLESEDASGYLEESNLQNFDSSYSQNYPSRSSNVTKSIMLEENELKVNACNSFASNHINIFFILLLIAYNNKKLYGNFQKR